MADTEIKRLVCRDCQRVYPVYANFCGNCGQPFTDAWVGKCKRRVVELDKLADEVRKKRFGDDWPDVIE